MDTHKTNMSQIFKKLEKIKGGKYNHSDIQEIETFNGKY